MASVTPLSDEVKTLSSLKSEVLSNSPLSVLFFSVSWSKACTRLSQVLTELSSDIKSTQIITIDAEKNESLCMEIGVESVPLIILFKYDREFGRLDGSIAIPTVVETLKKFNGAPVSLPSHPSSAVSAVSTQSESSVQEESTADVRARIDRVINSGRIVVIMKGSPSAVKCKFSRQLMEIFEERKLGTFQFYDILTDPAMRSEIKEYKKWKSFPQIYKDGELIGGLDVIREIIEEGEFESTFMESEIDLVRKRIDAIINQSRVVLMMKGNPDSPQCGFSAKMISLLNENGLKSDSGDFNTFDILSDEQVRQEIKEYKKWRTFPQLYIDGELVGGLDVCKEMAAEDELAPMLLPSA